MQQYEKFILRMILFRCVYFTESIIICQSRVSVQSKLKHMDTEMYAIVIFLDLFFICCSVTDQIAYLNKLFPYG